MAELRKKLGVSCKPQEEEEKVEVIFIIPKDNDPNWCHNPKKGYRYYKGKQMSDEERKHRAKRVTASNAACAAGALDYPGSSILDLIRITLGLQKKCFDQASIVRMTRGTKMEPKVRELYEKKTGYAVTEFGMFIPDWNIRFGASPDGIVKHDDGSQHNIEIKVPGDGGVYLKLREMREAGRHNFPDLHHDHIKIEHYCQMIMTMAVTKSEFCDYIVYGYKSYDLYIERVWYNEEFWEDWLYPRLLKFLEMMDDYERELDEC